MTSILNDLGIEIPVIQAPMAGVSNPDLAAIVCETGALGSIAVGAAGPADAREKIGTMQELTSRAFNVNVFCHAPAQPDPEREKEWLSRLSPAFEQFDAEPPKSLGVIYRSFLEDDDMLAVFLELKPKIISFHFGLPGPDRIAALKESGATLMATATNADEARTIVAAGVDIIVAQGIEAGGHRGMFDPTAHDEQLETATLTQLLRREIGLPIISAGGIIDGAQIAEMLRLGAIAAQIGTAFIACPESSADADYRAALLSPDAETTLTPAISGRPARCLVNRITRFTDEILDASLPDYPIAYDAGKALAAAAKSKGEGGFSAQWAGQGAPRLRAMPARDLVKTLNRELNEAMGEAVPA